MEGSTKILRVLTTFLIVQQIYCELRFCYNGPQKVANQDCPAGIYFKEPITSQCMYYAPDGPSIPTYSTGVCTTKKTPFKPKTKMDPTVIQALEFDTEQPEGPEVPPTVSSFDSINDPSCIQECFDNVDPWALYKADDEMPEYSFVSATCSDEILEQQLNISEALFDYLFFGQETEAKIPTNRLHQLLEMCGLILVKHCGDPYIKPTFMSQAFEALKYMHYKVNAGSVIEFPAEAYTSIAAILQKCLEYPSIQFQVRGLKCASKAKIETIGYGSRQLKYRLEPKSYRFGKFDIFIEAAWAAMDFAHSFCFEEFRLFPYQLDMLAEHLGRIFSIKEISERWYCPVELKNPDFWNNLAGVGDIKWTMRNVDFCAQAAAKTSVFNYRIERTFEQDTDSHDFGLLGPPADKKGWTGTEDAYWKAYNNVGGVRNVLKETDHGICAANPREMAIYKEQHGLTC